MRCRPLWGIASGTVVFTPWGCRNRCWPGKSGWVDRWPRHPRMLARQSQGSFTSFLVGNPYKPVKMPLISDILVGGVDQIDPRLGKERNQRRKDGNRQPSRKKWPCRFPALRSFPALPTWHPLTARISSRAQNSKLSTPPYKTPKQHQGGFGVGVVAPFCTLRFILPHGPVLAMPLMTMNVAPPLVSRET